MSVRLRGTTRLLLDGNPWNLAFIIRKSVERIQGSLKFDKKKIGTLHEYQWKFMKISGRILLRMRNVSDKSCCENQNTYFIFNSFFFLENRAVYKIMWKNAIQSDRPQRTI